MNRYLIDTTYILPFFGINLDMKKLVDFLDQYIKEPKFKLEITSCSIIEAKWKALSNYNKLKDNELLSRSNITIESLYRKRNFKIINPWKSPLILEYADSLYKMGHKDYFDCLIVSTALIEEIPLISEDKDIRDIVKQQNNSWQKLRIFSFKEFLRII